MQSQHSGRGGGAGGRGEKARGEANESVVEREYQNFPVCRYCRETEKYRYICQCLFVEVRVMCPLFCHSIAAILSQDLKEEEEEEEEEEEKEEGLLTNNE